VTGPRTEPIPITRHPLLVTRHSSLFLRLLDLDGVEALPVGLLKERVHGQDRVTSSHYRFYPVKIFLSSSCRL
jgi:hypothetical protein